MSFYDEMRARADQLDTIHELVNSLGGVPANDLERVQNEAIHSVLVAIERLGGMDPGERRRQRAELERLTNFRRVAHIAAE